MQTETSDDPMRWCPRCERGMPASLCRQVELGELTGTHALVCGQCGGVTRAVEVAEHHDLASLYRGAWRYPFADGHWIGLVALGAGAWFFGHAPVFGAVLAASIVATYLLSVVQQTARGEDDLPAPTDFIHWTDYLGPASRGVAAALPGLMPLVAVLWWGRALPDPVWYALLGFTAAIGLAWLPGALAWAAFAGGFFEALDPRPVLALATRIPRDYAMTVGVVWALALAHAVAMVPVALLAGVLSRVPVVPGVAEHTAGIVLPMVMARVVGLLLRARRMEIGLDG